PEQYRKRQLPSHVVVSSLHWVANAAGSSAATIRFNRTPNRPGAGGEPHPMTAETAVLAFRPRPRGAQRMPRTLAHLSDEALVALVERGEEDALAELYDRYGRTAYGLALRMLRD